MNAKVLKFQCYKADLMRAFEKNCGANAVIENGADAEGIIVSLLSRIGNGELRRVSTTLRQFVFII